MYTCSRQYDWVLHERDRPCLWMYGQPISVLIAHCHGNNAKMRELDIACSGAIGCSYFQALHSCKKARGTVSVSDLTGSNGLHKDHSLSQYNPLALGLTFASMYVHVIWAWWPALYLGLHVPAYYPSAYTISRHMYL